MLTVLEPGPLTTVQDQGRIGHAHLGVSRSGAADRASLRLANRLVGNAEAAAGLEVTLGGFRARAEESLLTAMTGAAGPLTVDERPAAYGEAVRVPAGAVLEIGRPGLGLRSYLAVRGGFDVQPVLGSRSTDTLSLIGPPRLHAGAAVAVGRAGADVPASGEIPGPALPGDRVLRVVLGPRDSWFRAAAVEQLLSATWTTSSRADRVGVRLQGPPLARSRDDELPSEGCLRGSIQVSTDGVPTLLGPDHPVTGGYPVIAVVVDADCDVVGQLRPGDRLRFERAR